MSYSYQFTSTHRDLLDSFDATRTGTLGMRRFARAGIAGVGLMWLAGGLATPFMNKPPQPLWLSFVWLFFGGIVTWKFVVQPIMLTREIRKATASMQNVAVTFDEAGILMDVEDSGIYRRVWDEVVWIFPTRKGIVFGFSDGVNHWLPNRVFGSDDQRDALIQYVRRKALPADGRA